MTSANIPALVRGHGADGQDLAQDTDVRRAGLGGDPIQGVGGGPRVHGGGGPTPGIEAVAVDPGTGERRKNLRNGQRRLPKVTVVPGDPGALVGGTDEAAVRLGHQEEGCPGLHHPDVTRKKKRRTRSVRRSEIETGGRTGTGAGMRGNAPAARRAKTRNEIGTASLIVRKEM